MKTCSLLLFGLLTLIASAPAETATNAAPMKIEKGSFEEQAARLSWEVKPDAALPNVLILGDSISIGYTLRVREQLKGAANVYRPMDANKGLPANCGDTARGLTQLDAWLGTTKYRVIVFNFGLHDLKYLDAKGKYVSAAEGKQVAPPEVYERNLRELVARLKKTGATLIWASTTPVPEGAVGRVPGDERVYNEVAARVMKDNGVTTADLCGVVTPQLATLQKRKDVHFTAAGNEALAKSVTESVRAALNPRP